MQKRGRCIEGISDLGSTYTFLFSQNPDNERSCYHCVRFFARTVNVIEKIESNSLLNFSFLPAFTSKRILTHLKKTRLRIEENIQTYLEAKILQQKSITIILVFAAGCLNFNHRPTLEEACRRLDSKQQLITFFAENYSPINCRSSLEGVFHFDYQVKDNSRSNNMPILTINFATNQNADCTLFALKLAGTCTCIYCDLEYFA